MKFTWGLGRLEKRAYVEDWHLWFAWRPVRTESREWSWLETVARKGRPMFPYARMKHNGYEGWYWEYRTEVFWGAARNSPRKAP